jgi:hypothetical protein
MTTAKPKPRKATRNKKGANEVHEKEPKRGFLSGYLLQAAKSQYVTELIYPNLDDKHHTKADAKSAIKSTRQSRQSPKIALEDC